MDRYIGETLNGRYELIEKIGEGGMAVVYKALCHSINRYVAVKILKGDCAVDEGLRNRFSSEAHTVGMLNHPNIVTIYDIGNEEDLYYIVMELIVGCNLKEFMQKKGAKMDYKEALHFAIQISQALIHAHGKGIIHRDIKPQNIIILDNGSIKVTDFGIARLSSVQNSLTTGTMGSVHYISPEQARGTEVDARTDIYSLGVVMYEMLTGVLPFDGDTAVSVALKHINETPLQPSVLDPNIPPELERITMKAMSKEKENRYSSAAELLEDLERFRKKLSGEALAEEVRKEQKAEQKREGVSLLSEGVRPVKRREPNRKTYRKRLLRSRMVSILSGMACVAVFILAIFLYLWKYWLNDMFTEPETMQVPNLVATKLDDVLQNPGYTDLYNILPSYESSESVKEGVILGQSPAAGRTVIKSGEKANLKVTVSSGTERIYMPDLVNKEYRSAYLALQKMKLEVKEDVVGSKTVTEGYVISTEPQAGEELKPGDTVFLTISSGPNIVYVTMPKLCGLSLQNATARIEASNLTLGSISRVEDETPEGTVIFQSTVEGSSVPEHTKINLNVSSGPPASTATPEESAAPTEAEQSALPSGTKNGG